MDFFSHCGVPDDPQNKVTICEVQATIARLMCKATRCDAGLVSLPKILATEIKKVSSILDDTFTLSK